jgi:hypothetical protein
MAGQIEVDVLLVQALVTKGHLRGERPKIRNTSQGLVPENDTTEQTDGRVAIVFPEIYYSEFNQFLHYLINQMGKEKLQKKINQRQIELLVSTNVLFRKEYYIAMNRGYYSHDMAKLLKKYRLIAVKENF